MDARYFPACGSCKGCALMFPGSRSPARACGFRSVEVGNTLVLMCAAGAYSYALAKWAAAQFDQAPGQPLPSLEELGPWMAPEPDYAQLQLL